MGKRKTSPLAYCEYVSPEPDESTQVWLARTELIDVSRRVFKEFLESLSVDVLPFYSSLANDGFNFDQILWVHSGLSPYALLPKGNLKSTLFKWAEKYNSEKDRWVLDGALWTLRFWHVAPEKRTELEWFKMHSYSGMTAIGQQFTFECEGWETERVTWSEYNQSVRHRFEKKLLGYEEQTRKYAESRGLVRSQAKYSPDNLEWFVLYQFAGWSSSAIARQWSRENKVSEDSTVLKGIKAAARLVEWSELRPVRTKRNRKIR